LEQLRPRDFRALLEFLREAYALRDLDGFVSHLLSSLSELVPAEATVYNEYNFKRNRIIWRQDPDNFAFAGSERIWERYSHEHPILDYIRRTKDGHAVKFSDFVSPRQFRRTSLYNEFFRPVNISHQMHVLFSEPRSVVVGIALNREARDFSERERLLLNLLRPHLLRVYQNAGAVTEILQETVALRRALEQLDRGVIFLSRNGKIKSMTATARGWIDRYFGKNGRCEDHLPEELELWLKWQKQIIEDKENVHPPLQPFAVERDGKRLRAWLIADPRQNIVALEEQPTALDPSSLQSLGLTRREAEVLAWIAYGKTNADIGTILDAKPRTIEKHVERILEKLCVETRTAAVAVAFRAAQKFPPPT